MLRASADHHLRHAVLNEAHTAETVQVDASGTLADPTRFLTCPAIVETEEAEPTASGRAAAPTIARTLVHLRAEEAEIHGRIDKASKIFVRRENDEVAEWRLVQEVRRPDRDRIEVLI